jgi:hypothetical protein
MQVIPLNEVNDMFALIEITKEYPIKYKKILDDIFKTYSSELIGSIILHNMSSVYT